MSNIKRISEKRQFSPLLIIYHLHWHQWSKVMAFSCSSLNSLLKNVQHFYQRLQLSRDMMQTVKTIQNHKQHFNQYFHNDNVLAGPHQKPSYICWPDHIRPNFLSYTGVYGCKQRYTLFHGSKFDTYSCKKNYWLS